MIKHKLATQKIGLKGLPPRSPFLTNRYHQNRTTTITANANANAFSHSLQQYPNGDDDSESNESGGPLWQLAKLQAMSEGKISSNTNTTTASSVAAVPSSSLSSSTLTTSSLSSPSPQSSMSVITSSSSSTTDPYELQMRQAERNLRAMHSLAQQHLYHNEIPEAIEVLQEMLRGVRQLHGETHYRVGTVLHNLSMVYMKYSNNNNQCYDKAKHICRQAVHVRMRTLGTVHADLALSLEQLGSIHFELEEYELAIQSFKRALMIIRKIGKNCNESAGITKGTGSRNYENETKITKLLSSIGCAYYEWGKLKDSEMIFQEALMIQKSLMHGASISVGGDGGSDAMQDNIRNISIVLLGIASTLFNLGSVKLRWKKYDDAILNLEEALLLQQSILGDEHPTVTRTKECIELVSSSRSSSSKMVRIVLHDGMICF